MDHFEPQSEAQKARASGGLMNELGLTPCKAQDVEFRAFVSLGAPRALFSKHIFQSVRECWCRVSDMCFICIHEKRPWRVPGFLSPSIWPVFGDKTKSE